MKSTLGALIIAFVVTASVLAMPASGQTSPAAGQTQSVRSQSIRELVELSRGERARRTGQTVEGRVFTSEDIQRYVAPVPEGEDAPVADGGEAAEGAAAASGPSEAPGEAGLSDPVSGDVDVAGNPEEVDVEAAWVAWQSAIQAQTAEIQALEDQAVSQQLSMNEMEATVTAPTGTQQARNLAMTQLAGARSSLEQTEQMLAEASAELNALLAQDPALEN
jgi:hypothetical protein